MAVITVNGQIGCAVELGREVADRLNAEYVDRQVLVEAGRRVHATEAALAAQEVRRWNTADRLRAHLEAAFTRGGSNMAVNDPLLLGWWEFIGLPYPRTEAESVPARLYLEVVSAVIQDVAVGGNAVIVGRASNLVLRDRQDVLHVRTVAPEPYRVTTVMGRQGIDRPQAERYVQEQEAARIKYYQRFFRTDEDDALTYHLVLNVGALGINRSAALVLQAAAAVPQRA
jgi:hypothetical protein